VTAEPTAEDRRAVLIVQCMEAARAAKSPSLLKPPDAIDKIGAILDYLAGEGCLVDPGDVQTSVGVVFGLWQDAKAEIVRLRGLTAEALDAHGTDLASEVTRDRIRREAGL